ncbi:hypothetical protein F2Q70_00023176 [Brassica cretica]|uniref:Uncharacterized protein n=1 Tax=Brassica cretica TaxID=69181 RepID=A0A8S9GSW5_BRACR|nr:hypothetical protein F2Q70_00023176 [Brassica cretica]
MSSSQGGKRNSDVEMGEATSPAPILTSSIGAPACVADQLSFREKLVRREAEKEPVQAYWPLLRVMGPRSRFRKMQELLLARAFQILRLSPPDRPRLQSSSRIRRGPLSPCLLLRLRAGIGSPPRAVMGNLRNKEARFMSLIDGMISECGSEASRLAGELSKLQGRWSKTEAMLTAVKDSHSAKVSKLEVEIGELERDLGKTASSLLKEKKARKGKSSEVRRLQRHIEGDARLASRRIREAIDALRSEFQARLAKISAFLDSSASGAGTWRRRRLRVGGPRDGDFDLVLADLKSACLLPTCPEDPDGKDPVVEEDGDDAAPGLDEATGEEGA